MKNYIISIDGHSGCGKSTLAKKLALELRYTYVDTGAMYRAVALFALQNSLIDEKGKLIPDAINEVEKLVIDFTDPNEEGESYIQLNGLVVEKEIRSIEVSDRVSEVSKHEYIRRKLVLIQQKFGKEQNIVMDGRDIGTVVFPNADIKFWIKASAQKRAERRWEEYKSKGENVEFQKVLDNIISRDKQDSNREVSPLKKPKGAIEIDTSNINIEQTCDLALSYVKKLLP